MDAIKNFLCISGLIIIAICSFLFVMKEPLDQAIDAVKYSSDYYQSEEEINQEIEELSSLDISEIVINPETQIYWGENDDIGSNLYLANVNDLFDRNKHPLEKHGIKAVLTLSCISNGRGVVELKRQDDGRKAVICEIDINDLLKLFTLEEIQEADPTMTLEKLSKYNGKYGVGIFESDGTSKVTLFIKESLKRLPQVIKYLANQGYSQ